jgi:hypothetical protein
MAIDALSLELPKSVAELGVRMGNCLDIAKTILEFFVSNCNPRDMLSILCEVSYTLKLAVAMASCSVNGKFVLALGSVKSFYLCECKGFICSF